MTENTRPAILDNPEAFVVVPVEPVAWLDDGTTRAGSTGTSFRCVTDAAKKDMPRAVAESFTTPLFARPEPTALADLVAYTKALEDLLVKQSNSLSAENARLREALTDTRSCIKNARGAVESNQVHDKDVHGTLSRAVTITEAALHGTDRAALSTKGEA